MFFKWFVPYTNRGVFLMASLLIPALTLLGLSQAREHPGLLVWVAGGGFLVQLIFGSIVVNYHRRVSGILWLGSQVLGVTLIGCAVGFFLFD